MNNEKRPIEDRVTSVEKDIAWMKPVVSELAKQLDLSRPRVNPIKYCKSDLDKKIIAVMIEKIAASSTEIAAALGLEKPEKLGRHLVGKRLKRIAKEASVDGWDILTFNPAIKEHPTTNEKKYRAWWLNISEIDIEGFKKSMGEFK
jgi:hypothetical protein